MVDRLPPLTALRAFESAARHLSFAQAAAELNVTPAALSFQIKSLEAHLGAPLFHRLNRAVALTEAGEALAPGTSDGFQHLARAWQAARRSGDQSGITITAGPAFTAKWLAPRLFGFASTYPDIDLRFSATLRLVDLERDDIDVAIRFGMGGSEPGTFSQPIIREWVTPMMSPKLAERVRRREDIRDLPLLHQDDIAFLDPPIDWPAWFRAADLGEPRQTGPRFSQADHAIDAAETGAGVVLGRISLGEKSLREGRLVAPFKLALRTEAHYCFICREGLENKVPIKPLLDWLAAEVTAIEELEKGREFVDAADVAP